MRLATVAESRLIDDLAQKEFGLPGEILMEAAGSLAAREIEQAFLPELKRGSIGIVCGPGNNGADGLVVARHLHSSGYRGVRLFLVAPPEKQSGLFKIQLERCRKIGLSIKDCSGGAGAVEGSEWQDELAGSGLVIDAIFGTGLKSEVRAPVLGVIEALDSVSAPVVSLDTPSGLESDRGVVLGAAVRATMTITFGLAKPGFFVSEGPAHVGRLRVLPIGFPQELFRRCASTHRAFTETRARRALPKRGATTNKSSHGHALIFAGRPGMWGAALLASSSAYRMGAGYVTLASVTDPREVLEINPEILTAAAHAEELWAKPKWTAVGVGPGLGTGKETLEILLRLKKVNAKNVVVDADAITVVAEHKIYPLPESWVLTPHAGELSRILGVPAKEIEGDRYRYAREAAKLTGCHVLLKGFRSVLAYQDKAWVILSGNSALAKAGTGDVLTGMMTGLLAQGVPTAQAAGAAAYIHGRLADEWVRSGHDKRSLQASDLRDILPSLLARL